MFSLKNKLDPNLKMSLEKSFQQKYRVLIKCKKFQSDIEKKILSLKGDIIRLINSQNLICALLTQKSIERLIEYPEIEYVCFDEYAHICAMSISTANGGRIYEKHKLSGRGVSIGLIDSGVFPHVDLLSPSNRITKFVDLINHSDYPYDDNGHGTFIAGILCGSGQASKYLYRGIAEKSNLICYKAFNSTGKGYVSDILYSLDSLIEESESHNIKVICMPFELLTHNLFIISLFHNLFKSAASRNIISILPSGSNINGEGSINPLCCSPDCIVVGGVDTSKSLTKPYIYSSSSCYNKNYKPNLSTACVNITSINTDITYISQRNGIKIYPTKLENPYTVYTGTSISAAYISGICALLFEGKGTLTFKDVVSLLKLYCEPLEESKDLIGEGLLNVENLLSMIL